MPRRKVVVREVVVFVTTGLMNSFYPSFRVDTDELVYAKKGSEKLIMLVEGVELVAVFGVDGCDSLGKSEFLDNTKTPRLGIFRFNVN